MKTVKEWEMAQWERQYKRRAEPFLSRHGALLAALLAALSIAFWLAVLFGGAQLYRTFGVQRSQVLEVKQP